MPTNKIFFLFWTENKSCFFFFECKWQMPFLFFWKENEFLVLVDGLPHFHSKKSQTGYYFKYLRRKIKLRQSKGEGLRGMGCGRRSGMSEWGGSVCVCVWVLYCLLSNACPPHSTQSLSLSVVEKGTITLAFFAFCFLCFLSICLCLLLLLASPSQNYCKWGRNHTLNFLLLFDTTCTLFF